MYYSPPKSSCWGHSLDNMMPRLQRERFEQFFSQAVFDRSFFTGSLFYMPPTDGPFISSDFEQHFLDILNVEEKQPAFSNLNEDQFELCFNEIINNPHFFIPGINGVAICSSYLIQSWKINGSTIPTKSHLHIYYGGKSVVIPRLSFDNAEEFEFIKKVLCELELCSLNPEHLKIN
jgi:hypothetical protein